MTLTAPALRNVLDYAPDSGLFRWKVGRGRARAGDIAGCLVEGPNKYRWVQIRVFGKLYPAHRLAWLWVHGEEPEEFIDHLNQDAVDNRISNLRVLPHAANCRNQPMRQANTSGVCGVYWEERTGKWRAEVKFDGKKHRVGRFSLLADAELAVAAKRSELGFSSIHGLKKRGQKG